MNLYLHGIGHENGSPIHVDDALANKPSTTYDMVLTNPPFGKKSSVTYITEAGEVKREAQTVVWFYDYRTNIHHTLKQNPLTRADLDAFVACFNPANRFERAATWGEGNGDGRWRAYTLDDILARDKVNLDIFWLRDESLEDTDNLPDPDVLAEEIVEELEAALVQFRLVAEDVGAGV